MQKSTLLSVRIFKSGILVNLSTRQLVNKKVELWESNN